MRRATIMLALGLLGTGAVAAQQPRVPRPPASGREGAGAGDGAIVVVGQRGSRQERIVRAARAVSQDLTNHAPVARFFAPVCVAVTGLERPYAAVVERRIALVAREAGVATDPAPCRANILVRVVEDGAAELTALRSRESWLFEGADPGDVRRAVDEAGPVHVWTATQLLNSDGLPGPVREASIIVLTKRRDMVYSLVLMDRAAVIGRTLDQLADYAAMRALARIRPGAGAVGDTILALFDGPSPPAGLTGFDRGYLKGLYSGPGNLSAAAKMRQVARAVQRADPLPEGE